MEGDAAADVRRRGREGVTAPTLRDGRSDQSGIDSAGETKHFTICSFVSPSHFQWKSMVIKPHQQWLLFLVFLLRLSPRAPRRPRH